MKMTDKSNDIQGLDALLEAARHHRAQPSPALMARVLQDAQTVQRGFAAPAMAPVRGGARPRGEMRLMALIRDLGGWPALTGLAMAGVVGLWIGVSPPQSLVTTAQVWLGVGADEVLIDVVPDAVFGFGEGTL